MGDVDAAARKLLTREVEEGRLFGAALHITVGGETRDPVCVGSRRLSGPTVPVEPDTIFLIASLTKPIVAAAVMKVIEQDDLALEDPVSRFVPEFATQGKSAIRIRHLLTHTSGLPYQFPENREYRKAKRPLADFVQRICQLPLAFEPGSHISYQSAGIAMLGEIIERITGEELTDYLEAIFFGPLGLEDTCLKLTERSERESDVRIAGEGLLYGGSGTDFDWNSDYWRRFGAPWGGMLTTVEEMTRLLHLFRGGGELDGVRILDEHTVAKMIHDQTSNDEAIDAEDRRNQRWGLGWRLGGGNQLAFGHGPSHRTFGHGGATGTVAWIDPEVNATFVLLTNDPAAASGLKPRLSNLVSAAIRR
ncbi:MAG: serine hydrolase domain-containing protein [Candidatus Latescibacterota bacterium]|nr:serine hydrolase domain-containing protein [Candidatus Latescibacterota bacterium]